MAVDNGLHGNSSGVNVHVAYAFEYADETAREAATGFAPSDVGKFARQLDNNTIWMLVDDSPVTWVGIGSATAIHTDVAGEFDTLDEKATPVAGDKLLIEDSEDSGAKKWVDVDNLPGGGALTTASANLTGADVTLTANAWTDVVSLSLAAGTWLVWADMHLESGAVQTLEGRITDGTTVYASGGTTVLSTGVRDQIGLTSEPITLGSTTTIKLQGFTQAATTAGKAKLTTPSGQAKATSIRALKVA